MRENNNCEMKIIDCVQFKQDLHDNSFKASGAKNFSEYIECVNKNFMKSQWYTSQNIGYSNVRLASVHGAS